MGDNTNTGPTGEQPTSADIDQDALAQLKRQLGELTGGELDLTDVQVINLITAIGARTDGDGSVTYRRIMCLGSAGIGWFHVAQKRHQRRICGTTLTSKRGGRSSWHRPGTATTTPISGVLSVAPTPRPASLP